MVKGDSCAECIGSNGCHGAGDDDMLYYNNCILVLSTTVS